MYNNKMPASAEQLVQIDAHNYTEAEKQHILQVVARDEGVRIQQRNVVRSLAEQLNDLKEKGIPDDDDNAVACAQYYRCCKRCRIALGFVFNSGALCPGCGEKVCKTCRVFVKRTIPTATGVRWLCVVCSKFRDIMAGSGAWFHSGAGAGGAGGQEMHVAAKKKVHGSMLLKMVFSMLRKKDYVIYKDPVWNEVVQDHLKGERDDLESEDDKDLLLSPSHNQSLVHGNENLLMNNDDNNNNNNSKTKKGKKKMIAPKIKTSKNANKKALIHMDDVVKSADTSPIVSHKNTSSASSLNNGDVIVAPSPPLVHPTSTLAGLVLVGFKHDTTNNNQFEVQIHSAKDVFSTELKTSASLYVKVYLTSATRSLGKKKTKTMKGTLSPEFDQVLTFDHLDYDELLSSTCNISVWNQEFSSKNISLGECDIHLEEIVQCGTSLEHPDPQWYTLLRTAKVVNKRDSLSALSLHSLSKKQFLDSHSLGSGGSRGSMLSLYSNAGGLSGALVITGEVLFSIMHCLSSNVFSVHIEKAKDITVVDTKHMNSNPYCKLYLYPDKTKSSKQKTSCRSKTTSPVWNETIRYEKITRHDVMKKTLQLSLWNRDRFGRNDFLGEVQVDINQYALTNDLGIAGCAMWYTLQEMSPISVSSATESKGVIKIRLSLHRGTLKVHLLNATGLGSADDDDSDKLPNTFVKCYLLPDKSSKGKRKTPVQKKSQAPVWDYKIEYNNCDVTDLRSRVLEVTVWNYNSSGHQFLGGARLGLGQGDEYWRDCVGVEEDIWKSVLEKEEGVMVERDVPLRPTMTSRKVHVMNEIPRITTTLITEEEDEGVQC